MGQSGRRHPAALVAVIDQAREVRAIRRERLEIQQAEHQPIPESELPDANEMLQGEGIPGVVRVPRYAGNPWCYPEISQCWNTNSLWYAKNSGSGANLWGVAILRPAND